LENLKPLGENDVAVNSKYLGRDAKGRDNFKLIVLLRGDPLQSREVDYFIYLKPPNEYAAEHDDYSIHLGQDLDRSIATLAIAIGWHLGWARPQEPVGSEEYLNEVSITMALAEVAFRAVKENPDHAALQRHKIVVETLCRAFGIATSASDFLPPPQGDEPATQRLN
jgi:hypothetical protein